MKVIDISKLPPLTIDLRLLCFNHELIPYERMYMNGVITKEEYHQQIKKMISIYFKK